MQDKVTFEYAIIRVVPKVEREEFFNVGVILFSKRKKYLGIKFQIDPKKLAAFCPDLPADLFERNLHAWKSICEGKKEGRAIGQLELSDRFRWLAAAKSTMIQCSKTHCGLCEDPESMLESTFNEFVA